MTLLFLGSQSRHPQEYSSWLSEYIDAFHANTFTYLDPFLLLRPQQLKCAVS